MKWYDFGLLLGIGFNELDAWKIQYQGDATICWNKVMDDWLTRGGSHDYPATWEGLYSLLNDLDFGMRVKKGLGTRLQQGHAENCHVSTTVIVEIFGGFNFGHFRISGCDSILSFWAVQ